MTRQLQDGAISSIVGNIVIQNLDHPIRKTYFDRESHGRHRIHAGTMQELNQLVLLLIHAINSPDRMVSTTRSVVGVHRVFHDVFTNIVLEMSIREHTRMDNLNDLETTIAMAVDAGLNRFQDLDFFADTDPLVEHLSQAVTAYHESLDHYQYRKLPEVLTHLVIVLETLCLTKFKGHNFFCDAIVGEPA
jgi:hypothetical protein